MILGFVDAPVTVKVVWSPSEVPLEDPEASTYGLFAVIPIEGWGTTRYLVPWEQVTYLKQEVPDSAGVGSIPGFLDTIPVTATVSWIGGEFPLYSGTATGYGLLAEVPAEVGMTRYLVPWHSLSYLKQDIPTPPVPPEPTYYPPTGPPVIPTD